MSDGRDPAAGKPAALRAQTHRSRIQRARILGRAVEEMGQPVAFSNLTMGEVSKRSGIPSSTILSQTALGDEGDQAGAVDEFRRLLFHRLVHGVAVSLTQDDRQEVIDGLQKGEGLQALIVLMVDSLCRQFCASPNAPYLLAASSRSHDEELADAVDSKWAEITDDAVFVIGMILAAHGHAQPEGVGQEQLGGALAMAMTTEFVHKKMLEPPAMQAVADNGVLMSPGAAVVWFLIESEVVKRVT